MVIQFKKLTIQNFFSYGEVQTINFTEFHNSVVLIDGIDKDTEGSKIGSGKSSIFAAITFVLFGETVSDVKVNSVVNYIKGKDCVVTFDFTIGSDFYSIKRGRAPKQLLIYKNEENITKADDKDNDLMLEQIIGMNFQTFLQTVLFSTADAKPFLELKQADQKKLFEYIFKFDHINDAINEMKLEHKDFLAKISEAEAVNKEIELSNAHIQKQIDRLQRQSEEFEEKKALKISGIKKKIEKYSKVDLDEELNKFSVLVELKELASSVSEEISELRLSIKDSESKYNKEYRELELLATKYQEEETKFEDLKKSICPTCKQEWKDEESISQSERLLDELTTSIVTYNKNVSRIEKVIKKLKKELKEKKSILEEIKDGISKIENKTILDKKELDNFDVILTNLRSELESLENQENYFLGEIEENRTLIREIDLSPLDKLKELADISKTFYKLADDANLRGKFLRKFIKELNEILRGFKQIISDYNIHIQFNPDLTIRLMKLGKEIPSGSLSNGERRIGNIMIMLALMKVFKLKNNINFNIMFLDEVLDSGINGALLENIYDFIIKFSKEEGIRIFLISHREEIKEKISEKIFVTKSRGISTISIVR